MNEQATEGASTSLDINRIMEMLPHRYPFLMIDRIKEMRGDEYGVGVKNVSINEPHFTGHFPSRPVFPGVLLIEGMAQTAGVMCLASRQDTASLVYFMSIDKAKFRRPVIPGDVVEHRMTRLHRRGSVWRYRGKSYVGDTLVAEAEVTAMIAKA